MCDVRVAAHTQNCPKKQSAENEVKALSCEAVRETFNKTEKIISLHFKPLFLVFINVLLKLLKESLWQGGLRCCSPENMSVVSPVLKKSWNRIQ